MSMARRLVFYYGPGETQLKRFSKRTGGMPSCVTVDRSGTNKAALDAINTDHSDMEQIEIRQNKYLNNLIEQDHRFIKRRIITSTRGFRSFRIAAIMGFELVHMIHKNQLIPKADNDYNLRAKKLILS